MQTIKQTGEEGGKEEEHKFVAASDATECSCKVQRKFPKTKLNNKGKTGEEEEKKHGEKHGKIVKIQLSVKNVCGRGPTSIGFEHFKMQKCTIFKKLISKLTIKVVFK